MNTDTPIFFEGSLLLANERTTTKINAPTSKHKTNQTADFDKFKILFFIFTYFIPYIKETFQFKDYKSILQEKLQSEKRSIRYEIVKDEGPANNKTFEAVVYMDNILMGRGVGKTKKEAQQNAAKAALAKEAQ